MALGWTTWMLSSFIRSDFSKFNARNSVLLVRGHVLQVSVEDDSLGTGIPTYKAVIDYMVPRRTNSGGGGGNNSAGVETTSIKATVNDNGDNDDDQIQIRKQFETQQLLQEGFSNVELLVLPNEPTHSVLKDDWQKEWEEHRHYDDEWWNRAWFRRTSTAAASALVLASVAGGIHVVTRLEQSQRKWGWIIMCAGVAVLLPSAIGVHYLIQIFQMMMNFQSERSGIVLRGGGRGKTTPHSYTGSSARMTPRGAGGSARANASAAPAGAVDSAHPFSCDDLDYLDPSVVCDDCENGTQGDESVTMPYYHCANPTNVSETAGCYTIRFPTSKKKQIHQRGKGSGSSSKANNSGGLNDSNNDINPETSSIQSTSTVSSISTNDKSTAATTGVTPFQLFNI